MPLLKLHFDVIPTNKEPFNTSVTVFDNITVGDLIEKVTRKINAEEPMMLVSSLGRPLDVSAPLNELNFDFDKEKVALIPKSAETEPFPEDVISRKVTRNADGIPHYDVFAEANHVNELDITHVYDILTKGTMPIVSPVGSRDVHGNPIFYSNALLRKKPEMDATFEEVMIAVNFMGNQMFKTNLMAKAYTTIVDMKGIGFSDYNAFEANIHNYLMCIFATKLPRHKVYMVNCPAVIRVIINVASRFLDPELVNSFMFLGDPSTGALDGYVDRDQLPKRWGGKHLDIQEWCDLQLKEKGYTKADVGTKPFPGGRPFMKATLDTMIIDTKDADLACATVLEQAIHSDVMSKQGYTVKKYKEFTFVLIPGMIYYYSKPTDSSPQGKIDLSLGLEVVDQGEKNFDIVCSYRTYFLCAPDKEVKEEWIKLVNEQIAANKKDKN
jgi:hypothetical protein